MAARHAPAHSPGDGAQPARFVSPEPGWPRAIDAPDARWGVRVRGAGEETVHPPQPRHMLRNVASANARAQCSGSGDRAAGLQHLLPIPESGFCVGSEKREIHLVELLGAPFETNIVRFRTAGRSAEELVAAMNDRGVLLLSTGYDSIRAVTHLQVNSADIDAAIVAFDDVLR